MADKVVAPLVIVSRPDGSHQYLYQGALVPDFVDSDARKALGDMIEKVSAAEAKNAPAPASESN